MVLLFHASSTNYQKQFASVDHKDILDFPPWLIDILWVSFLNLCRQPSRVSSDVLIVCNGVCMARAAYFSALFGEAASCTRQRERDNEWHWQAECRQPSPHPTAHTPAPSALVPGTLNWSLIADVCLIAESPGALETSLSPLSWLCQEATRPLAAPNYRTYLCQSPCLSLSSVACTVETQGVADSPLNGRGGENNEARQGRNKSGERELEGWHHHPPRRLSTLELHIAKLHTVRLNGNRCWGR